MLIQELVNMKITAIIMLFMLFSQTGCKDFKNFYDQKKATDKLVSMHHVARVGNRYITSVDLKHALNEIPFKQRILVESSESVFNNFLQAYINKELLYNEALELGLDKRTDVRMKSDAYLKRLLINTLTEELLNNKINEDEVMNYYRSNRDKFMIAKVTVISLYKNDRIRDEELQVMANKLRMNLINGSSFNSIKKSLDKNSALKYKIKEHINIPKNYYDNAVTEVIYSLRPNEISFPINLKNSYNIYKLEDKPAPISYANAKNQIKYEMRNTIYGNYLNSLKKNQGFEIYISSYKEISKND